MKKFDRDRIEDIYALTPMQEGMLFHYLKEPDSGLYVEQLVLHINGRLDIPALKKAWFNVTQINECLRTCFDWEKTGEPLQLVVKNHLPVIEIFDGNHQSAAEPPSFDLQRLKKEDRSKVTDLGTVPFKISLVRLGDEHTVMIMTSHHILYDGWSNGIILKELFHQYDSLRNRSQAAAESVQISVKTPFKAYVKELLKRKEPGDDGIAYWKGILAGEPDGRVPLKQPNKHSGSGTGTYRLTFQQYIVQKTEALARDRKMTAAVLLYAAWGLLLRRLNNAEDAIFGITVSGRSFPLPGIEDMVGLFINTLPMRVGDYDDRTTGNYLSQISTQLQQLKPYHTHSLARINEIAGISSRQDFFDSIIVVENYPLDQRLLPEHCGLTIQSYEMAEQTHYDLTLIAELFDGLAVTFSYNTEVLDHAAVDMLARYLERIVVQLLAPTSVLTGDIHLLSEAEKQEFLSTCHAAPVSYPLGKTIHQLFHDRAARIPDHAAVYSTSASQEDSFARLVDLNYHDLALKVNVVAAYLQDRGIGPGDIVALSMQRSVDMVIAILAILSAGAVYLPIDPAYPRDRVDYILEDSHAPLLIEKENITGALSTAESRGTEPAVRNAADKEVNPQDAAYIIYTSGSTGKPKGVVVEHGSAVNLLYAMQHAYPLLEHDVYMFKTSYVFDVSVTELFGWYPGGGALAVLSVDAEKDPFLIIDMIQQAKVTHINFVPSMFNAFVDVLDDDVLSKLSSLRYIFLAGEALPSGLVQRFTRFGLELSLENIYGPTEATVYASWYSLSRWTGSEPVPIGTPLPNVSLLILDQNARLQPIGGAGELCIGGKGLARGYLNKPQLTADRFQCHVIKNIDHKRINQTSSMQESQPLRNKENVARWGSPLERGGPRSGGVCLKDRRPSNINYHINEINYPSNEIYYHTGDLARWLLDGNIQYLGRMDQQVKVRGFRIELGEIENVLLSHDFVKEAAAVVVQGAQSQDHDAAIVAYVVFRESPPDAFQLLTSYLSSKLPRYMVPAYFEELQRLPLNAAGKLDRRSLPVPRTMDEPGYIAPQGEIENMLADIWSDVLAVDRTRLGVNHHFFKMGGHSLKATRLAARIYKHSGIRIPVQEIFKSPTIRSLAPRIEEYSRSAYISQPIPLAPEREYYPLTPAQKRLYLLQQRDLHSTSYNMPVCVELQSSTGSIQDRQVQKMQAAVRALIRQHESFRTSFISIDGRAVQRIHRSVSFDIGPVRPLGSVKDLVRPFDLSRAPLLRVSLFEAGPSRFVLFLDMHHIIADGASLDIFVSQFALLFSGGILPEPGVQYKDYAQWLDKPDTLRDRELERQRQYWHQEFSGSFDALPVLDLPLDFPRPPLLEFSGARVYFQLSSGDTRQLEQLAAREDATLFMALLTAYYIFLFKVSGQEELVIGIPGEGRRHDDLAHVIGMFVNTLAVRSGVDGQSSYSQYLNRVKTVVLTALENQDYQYEDLVNHAAGEHDPSRNPLFDAVFVLQELDISAVRLEGLTVKPYAAEDLVNTAKFDLTLTAQRLAGGLSCFFEYRTRLFRADTIRRFSQFFKRVVSQVLSHSRMRISDIRIISPAEKQRILEEFNDTASDYPAECTIHQLFEQQAEKTPGRIALIAESATTSVSPSQPSRLSRLSRRSPSSHLSYSELSHRAAEIAIELRSKGLLPEMIVAIVAERTIESMIGILGILKANGIYMPVDPDYPEERIQYMLKDSSAQFLITMEPGGQESLSVQTGSPHPEPSGQCTDGAYVMYTSGSTGGPKGVLVEHRNVVRLVKNTNYVDFSSTLRILQTGAPVFDATTFEMWGALLNGGQLILVDKTVILNATALGRAILDFQVNTMWLSSPLFNQICRDDHTIFSSLHYLLVGGDVLSPPMINRVRSTSSTLKVINGYGPTENTTFSTTFHIRQDYQDAIPIGSPIANSTAYIFDRYFNHQPIGIYGELWTGGDGVARGYLNAPEQTHETFLQDPRFKELSNTISHYNSQSQHGTRRMQVLYRTGDIVRWQEDGVIQFAGRSDDQVKIRGFRVECAEIETRLLSHDALGEAVVLPLTDDHGEKYLCAYFTATVQIEAVELRDYLAVEMPAYMIPGHFIQLEAMPLNPNGKINRKALPLPAEAVQASAPAAEESRTPDQQAVIELMAQVLSRSPNTIRLDDDFFQLGGHSLRAASLAARIHQRFAVNIPLAEIFVTPSPRQLTQLIRQQAASARFSPLEPVQERPYYPQSPAQKRLFILQKFEEGGTAYNIPSLWELTGPMDSHRLHAVFQKLILRHESLRTSFDTVNDVPVQIIHQDIDFSVETAGPVDSDAVDGLMQQFIQPFDLSCAPLFRVRLFSLQQDNYLLFFDMHHIISDGQSMAVFVREFMDLYDDRELPALAFRYRDYSHWLSLDAQRQQFSSQRQFWLDQFSGEIPLLSLPLDFPRPSSQCFKGGQQSLTIDEPSFRRLKRLASQQGATLFMVLLTLYNVLLSKLTGQEDIVIGSPVSGRPRPELEGIIGMFVNTLALRSTIRGSASFIQLLAECKDRSLSAFQNQDLPFEELVEALAIDRDAGRSPLFDTMLSLQNMERTRIHIPGLTIQPRPIESGISKFDMALHIAEEDNTLEITWEYRSDLFKAQTIQRMTRYFINLMTGVLDRPPLPVGDIDILTADEREQLLDQFNNHREPYPSDRTLHGLFMEQAAQTPHRIALTGICLCDGQPAKETYQLTYRQVDEASSQLARHLRRRGVGEEADQFVALLADRSVEQIIAMLAILKSGCAYAPLNSSAPAARSAVVINETRAALLLTNCPGETVEPVAAACADIEVIPLNSLWPLTGSGGADTAGQSLPDPDHNRLAYVIFTSGSTGRPKGVPIAHTNVTPLVFWHYAFLPFSGGDRCLQNLSFYFDWSVCDIFVTLTSGAELHLVPSAILLDPEASIAYMNRQRITVIHITPTQWQYLVVSRQKAHTLKHLLIGAEKLTYDLVRRSFDVVNPDCLIYNMYGPTECSILTAGLIMNAETLPAYKSLSSVPIGCPTANAQILILDPYGQLCPVHVPGELFIAGDCLSRGYLNDPEKTHLAFVANPYDAHGIAGSRLYRTGDLSRWLPNGEIEYLGRIDHQVKIRGFRIELGEIENRILEHDLVKETVVTAREDRDGDKYLCAYLVFRDPAAPVTPAALKQYLSSFLPDYMIPSYVVEMPELPLNPNGKVDRKNLPEPAVGGSASVYAAPATPVEQRLAEIWADVLDIQLQEIGRESRFFDLGGHSLKATLLASKVNNALGVNIPINEMFKTPSLRGMAVYISETGASGSHAVTAAELREYYPLSAAQNQMYLLQGLGNAGTIYNLPDAGIIRGSLDIERLETAFGQLIRRHESLRTSFHFIDGTPVQRIHDHVPFRIQPMDSPVDSIAPVIRDFIRPFDLSLPPLMRVLLARLEQDKHLMVLDLHHIIYDGYSSGILMRDFFQLYRGETLSPLHIHYKDFTMWQQRLFRDPRMTRLEQYWLEQFSGELPVLDMPLDFPRPGVRSSAGDRLIFQVSPPLTALVNNTASQAGTTSYTVLLAVFNILLSRYSGQQDIIIGVPAAGRSHADVQQVIGMFVNTLPLRNFPGPDKTFSAFLRDVKETTLGAYEHQDYPLETLLDRLDIPRDTSRNPLFDALFASENVDRPAPLMDGLTFTPYEYENLTSHMDLVLLSLERENDIEMVLEYATQLFKPETAEHLTRRFLEILEQAVNEPDVLLGDIQLSSDFSDTRVQESMDDYVGFDF